MAVPYTFAASTSAIPLANLDTNFAYFANAITVNATSTALTINSNRSAQFSKEIFGVDTIQCISTTTYPAIVSESQYDTNVYRPAFVQLNRRGATTTPTPSSSQIGEIRFQGYDSAGGYANFCAINAYIGTNQAGGAQSQMEFLTAAPGAQATPRMSIGGYRGSDVAIGCGAYGNIRLRVEQPSGSYDTSYPIQSWAYASYRVMDFLNDGNVSPVFNADPDSYWNPDTAYIWKFRNSELMRLKRTGTPAGALGIGTTSPGAYGEKLAVASGGSQQASIFILNPGIGSAQMGFVSNSSVFRIRNSYSDGTIQNGLGLDIGTNGVLFTVPTYNNTTGNGANVYVGSDGQVYRSTSSLKYKTDVQDSEHGLAEVMKLRSVTYKGINNPNTILGGLIAEEVEAAGLAEFVQYADDGTPDALSYGNMVSLLVKAVQQLKAEIDSLKS